MPKTIRDGSLKANKSSVWMFFFRPNVRAEKCTVIRRAPSPTLHLSGTQYQARKFIQDDKPLAEQIYFDKHLGDLSGIRMRLFFLNFRLASQTSQCDWVGV